MPTIVLAAKNEKSYRVLAPQFWEKKGLARPPGIFVPGLEKNYIALRLNVSGEHRYHIVYHEYVHLLMRLNYRPLPVWLNEGFAECFGHAVISGNSAEIGRPSGPQLKILREQQPLPLEELLAVDHDSPHYREESKTSIFYAQSWALTHLLLLGEGGAHASKLWKYFELIQKNVPRDEAAVRAFNNLEELEQLLNNYIRNLAFHVYKMDTPPVADPEKYSLRPVPSTEIAAVKGDFYVATRRWAEAREMLDTVLREDPKNIAALTSMGLYYKGLNQGEEARRHFVAAAELGSKSCMTHYQAGLAAAESQEFGKAEASLRQAVALNPKFAPAYSALAGILARKEGAEDTALQYALEAVKLEPGVLGHQLTVAFVLLNMKRVDQAIQYGESVQKVADSVRERQEAERFLAQAYRYRDALRKAEQTNKSAAKQRADFEARLKQYDSRLKQLETPPESMEDYEEARNEFQRLLKEREAAFKEQEESERRYLEEVNLNRAAGTHAVEGVVLAVRCFDPAVMELTLEGDEKQNLFHISNYYDIPFMAIGRPPEGEFNPCADLGGKKVKIEYTATPETDYTGEIQTLGIYNNRDHP
jgi:predicted Zn-dependent protease